MSHGGGGQERWLISYADFITLLMVLFVVLYSMANVDMAKYRLLAESLNRAFGGSGSMVDLVGEMQPARLEAEHSKPAVLDFPLVAYDQLDVSAELGNALAQAGIEGEVSVRTNIEGVIVSLSEELVFPSGGADIQHRARAALDSVAQVLAGLPNHIRVEGHTDDRRTNNPAYGNNWELSTARAISIVLYLTEKGIDPSRLSATGYASYRPLFPNDLPEHRQANRRASIVIIYPLERHDFRIERFPELQALREPVLPGSQ